MDFLCHVAHLRAHAFGVPVPPHGECEYCEGGARYGALLATSAALDAFKGEVSYTGNVAGETNGHERNPRS